MNIINELKIHSEFNPNKVKGSPGMRKLSALIKKYRKNKQIPEFKNLIDNYSSLFSKIGDYNDYDDYEYNSYSVKERYEFLDQMITDSFEKYLEVHNLQEKFETFKKMLKKAGSEYDIVKKYIENGKAGDLLHIIESLEIIKDDKGYEEEIKVYDAENEMKFAFLFPVKVESVRYQIKGIIEDLNKIKERKK
jgi:hypothetical protein